MRGFPQVDPLQALDAVAFLDHDDAREDEIAKDRLGRQRHGSARLAGAENEDASDRGKTVFAAVNEQAAGLEPQGFTDQPLGIDRGQRRPDQPHDQLAASHLLDCR